MRYGLILTGTCQLQRPGPLAWHLPEGQLRQEDPQAAGLQGLPAQGPVTQKLHLETEARINGGDQLKEINYSSGTLLNALLRFIFKFNLISSSLSNNL